MIFYGSKASKIKEGKINNVKCPNCDNLTSMDYTIFGQYAHLYWIPFFPIGRKNFTECYSCKMTFKVGELPEAIKSKFKQERQGVRTPIWFYSGFGVLAIAICLIIFTIKENDKNNLEYINSPQIDDVYSMKGSQYGFYTSMKITNVTEDSIFVIMNDYETDKRTGISKINKKTNYTNQSYSLSKEDVISLFNDETIFDIDRE